LEEKMKCQKFILILSFLFYGSVYGQNTEAFNEISYLTNTTGMGIRSLAMGGAVIANVKDYSAVYWNPAGLTFAKSSEFYASFSNQEVNNNAIFFNNLTPGRQSFTKFNSLGFMFSVPVHQGGLTFAVGYNRVADFNNILNFSGFNSNEGDEVYQSEDVTEEGGLNNLSFSGAFEAAKGFSLGATLTFIHGKHIFNSFLYEVDELNLYTFDTYNENRFIESRIRSFNAKVGMQYNVNRHLSIGGVMSFPKTFTIEDEFEKTTVTIYDSDINADPDSEYDEGYFKYKVKLPFTFGLGASYNLSGLILSGDIEYHDFSQIRYQTDTPIEGLTRGQANMDIRKNVEPITTKRLGLEFPFSRSLRLWGGYIESPNPLSFSGAENTRKYYIFGAGLKTSKNIELSFAYMRGTWKDKSIDDLVNIPVEEDRIENKIYVGILFKF